MSRKPVQIEPALQWRAEGAARIERAVPEETAIGVSYDEVVQVLEDEGVDKFGVSWNQLLETVKSEMAKSGAGE